MAGTREKESNEGRDGGRAGGWADLKRFRAQGAVPNEPHLGRVCQLAMEPPGAKYVTLRHTQELCQSPLGRLYST